MSKSFIHPTTCIDNDVHIGTGTRVWHFSHITSGAKIGQNCTLGQNTFIGSGVRIGNSCKLQNNVSVYEGVTLEDGVFCGPSCVFTNDPNPRALYPKKGLYKSTTVKRGASIGANATIVCGVTIGRYAFVGAGSLVSTNVPDYGLVYGVPASLRGWMCECGSKISFENEISICPTCQREFTLSPPGIVKEKN